MNRAAAGGVAWIPIAIVAVVAYYVTGNGAWLIVLLFTVAAPMAALPAWWADLALRMGLPGELRRAWVVGYRSGGLSIAARLASVVIRSLIDRS